MFYQSYFILHHDVISIFQIRLNCISISESSCCSGLVTTVFVDMALREKCLYSEFYWSVFSLFGLDSDQKNSEYGHSLCIVELQHVRKFTTVSSKQLILFGSFLQFCCPTLVTIPLAER